MTIKTWHLFTTFENIQDASFLFIRNANRDVRLSCVRSRLGSRLLSADREIVRKSITQNLSLFFLRIIFHHAAYFVSRRARQIYWPLSVFLLNPTVIYVLIRKTQMSLDCKAAFVAHHVNIEIISQQISNFTRADLLWWVQVHSVHAEWIQPTKKNKYLWA